jgi:hypothetical protein
MNGEGRMETGKAGMVWGDFQLQLSSSKLAARSS